MNKNEGTKEAIVYTVLVQTAFDVLLHRTWIVHRSTLYRINERSLSYKRKPDKGSTFSVQLSLNQNEYEKDTTY